mgnify:CR=1 FL=1
MIAACIGRFRTVRLFCGSPASARPEYADRRPVVADSQLASCWVGVGASTFSPGHMIDSGGTGGFRPRSRCRR